MKKYTYKTLKETDKQYLRQLHADEDKSHNEKMQEAEKRFGVTERTIRSWWVNLGLTNRRVENNIQLEQARERGIDKNTDVLLVTACQNRTNINKNMLLNMEAYSRFLKETKNLQAEIVVIPTRYRNPSNNIEDSAKQQDLYWDSSVNPYLRYGRYKFGDSLISADTWINPTAKQPLQGFELFASENHLLIGHPRIHSIPLPRLRGEESYRMCTTGNISVKNYSKSKAGQTAEAHHGYGFVVVEKGLIPRNVKVKSDGSFIDLIYQVENQEVSKIDRVDSIVLGDLHVAVLDKKFHNKVTLPLLKNHFKPKSIVVHDALDGQSFNPHEEKDLYVKKKRIRDGQHLIVDELSQTMEVLEKLASITDKLYVTESNHDVFLDRHINSFDWKKDLHNSEAYLSLAYIQQTQDLEKFGNIFGYLLHIEFEESGKVEYLKYGSSFKIQGYEMALHGDFGINGSRGNVRTLNRLNTKIIHGHTHVAMMMDNVTSVGVSCKIEQHYNRRGFSSWTKGHSTVLPNGKNQLLCFTKDNILTRFL